MQSRIAASLKSWLNTDPPPAAETGLRFGYGPSASDLMEDVRAAALHPPAGNPGRGAAVPHRL